MICKIQVMTLGEDGHHLSVPRCSYALRRIRNSRAQMLASGRSSPSMVGISSETVG